MIEKLLIESLLFSKGSNQRLPLGVDLRAFLMISRLLGLSEHSESGRQTIVIFICVFGLGGVLFSLILPSFQSEVSFDSVEVKQIGVVEIRSYCVEVR